MAADLGVVVIDNGDPAELEPHPFSVAYTSIDGERGEAQFHARGDIPYYWVLVFLASGVEGQAEQAVAALRFLEQVVVDEDRDGLLELLRDPVRLVDRADLTVVLSELLLYYETAAAGGDPTPKPKTKGRKSSAQRRGKS